MKISDVVGLNEIARIDTDDYAGGNSSLAAYKSRVDGRRRELTPLPGGSGFKYAVDRGAQYYIITIWAPNKTLVGHLHIEKVAFSELADNVYKVDTITTRKSYRGQGIAKSLYGIALAILKLTLIAGDYQTPGGRKNWTSLFNIPGAKVRGYIGVRAATGPKQKAERRQIIDAIQTQLGGEKLPPHSKTEMFVFDVKPNTTQTELEMAVANTAGLSLYTEDHNLYYTGLYAQWQGK